MPPRARTNFGERPKGWQRISYDVPKALARRLVEIREELPDKSSKLLAASAFAVYASLPRQARDDLYRWAHTKELEPENLDWNEALGVVLPILIAMGVVPPSGGPGDGQPALEAGEFSVTFPAVQRDGYTEQVVKNYVRAEPAPAKPAKPAKAAGGG